MIELDENSYVVGVWYSRCPLTNDNWMCCVKRSKENQNRYEIAYRFRYHKDDNIFDSADTKTWEYCRSKIDHSEDEIIKHVDTMQSVIKFKFPITDFMLVQGGTEKFIEVAKNHAWMNMKAEPSEKK